MKRKAITREGRISFNEKKFHGLMAIVVKVSSAIGQMNAWDLVVGKACKVACMRCKPKILALLDENPPRTRPAVDAACGTSNVMKGANDSDPQWKAEWLAALVGLIQCTDRGDLQWKESKLCKGFGYNTVIKECAIALLWQQSGGLILLTVGSHNAIDREKGSLLVLLLGAVQRQIIQRTMREAGQIGSAEVGIGADHEKVAQELCRLLG